MNYFSNTLSRFLKIKLSIPFLVLFLFIGLALIPRYAQAAAENIWGNVTPPSQKADRVRYELGTVFSPTVNGTITGVRVYAVQGESGTHTVRIWNNSTGAVVKGPNNFSASGTGWRRYNFSSALNVTAGTSYTVSITTGGDSTRRYAYQEYALTQAGSNGQNLTYPANAGVYTSTLGTRPTQTFHSSNYFRDVIFNASVTPTNTPTPTSTPTPTPTNTPTPIPPTATPTPNPTNFFDDFSSYPTGTCLSDGATFGEWQVVFTGFGCVQIENVNGNNLLHEIPQVVSDPGQTSASLVVGPLVPQKMVFTGRLQTVAQTRLNTPPNAWETAWIVWHYTDNEHFYYFIPKPNGWELGKRDPAYLGGQRFLATGSSPTYPIGSWYDFKVEHGTDDTMTVSINGVLITTFTDTELPYRGGKIGLYNEDAHVHFDDISVSSGSGARSFNAITITDPWDMDEVLASWNDADHAFNAAQVVFDEPSAVNITEYGTSGVLDNLAELADKGAALWLIIIDSYYLDQVTPGNPESSANNQNTTAVGRFQYLDGYTLADGRTFGNVVKNSGGGIQIVNEATGGSDNDGQWNNGWFDAENAIAVADALSTAASAKDYDTALMVYTSHRNDYPRDFGDSGYPDISQATRGATDLVLVSFYAVDSNWDWTNASHKTTLDNKFDTLFSYLAGRYSGAHLGKGECGIKGTNTQINAELTACYGYLPSEASVASRYVTYGGYWYADGFTSAERQLYPISNSANRTRHQLVKSVLPAQN